MGQAKARMPNLSLQRLNAHMILYHNNLIEYYAQKSANEKKLMRANAQTYLSSQQEKRWRVAHAEFREKRAHEHEQQTTEKKQKKDEDARKLADCLRAVKVNCDRQEGDLEDDSCVVHTPARVAPSISCCKRKG
jgi:phage-related minor tail protein